MHEDRAVHYAHCGVAPHEGRCAYGDDACPVVLHDAAHDQAHHARVVAGAKGLARHHHPDYDPTDDTTDKGMPLWFSYLDEANAVLVAVGAE